MWRNRKLWGVEFHANDGERIMIGSAWQDFTRLGYESEPTRALLFVTRKAARDWCKTQNVRLSVVRVIEDVRRVK